MHLAIRADGGPQIGYGHLIRSAALAEEALREGHTVTVGTTTPERAETVFPETVGTISLPKRSTPGPLIEWLDTDPPDVVFTDAYPVDTAYQRAIRERVPLAVLQDDARHAVCAELFVNGNVYGPDLNYEFVGDPPKTCLGTDYVFLRSEIRARITDEPPWREQPRRAIVMMGGSDTARLTPTVIQAFDRFDLRVDAIVGPGCTTEQEQAVRRVARECSADIRVARDPDNLVERMLQADFGVSTASSATYEHLALGTPIVSIPVVDNQEPIAAALRSRDAATVLQRNGDQHALRTAIETYITDAELRRRRRQIGQELVDGCGVERLICEVVSIVEEHQRS